MKLTEGCRGVTARQSCSWMTGESSSAHGEAPPIAPKRSTEWLAMGSAALLAVWLSGALVVSFVVSPEDIESGRVRLTPPCTFQASTGLPCPTCGLTRAFSALSHGHLNQAISYHRASPVLYVVYWLIAAASVALVFRLVRNSYGTNHGKSGMGASPGRR
ncbi:MAG: DUF2752 domain-containing protein [Polyangiaceae bacterium]